MQVNGGKLPRARMAEIMGAAFDADNLKSGLQQLPKDFFILQRHKPFCHALRRQRLVFQFERQIEPLEGRIAGRNGFTLFGEHFQEALGE